MKLKIDNDDENLKNEEIKISQKIKMQTKKESRIPYRERRKLVLEQLNKIITKSNSKEKEKDKKNNNEKNEEEEEEDDEEDYEEEDEETDEEIEQVDAIIEKLLSVKG